MLSRVGLHVWGQYLSVLLEVSEESVAGPATLHFHDIERGAPEKVF